MIIEFHRKLLSDKIRNRAFHDALKRVIKPGRTTVADIGSGTGFLGFIASRLGAKHCDLYEHSGALKLSQQIGRLNRIRNCRYIHRHSADVRHPAKADVVVSETLGNFCYEENIIETIEDGKRFLKPGGIIIPQQLFQFVSPVISDRLYRKINIWDEVGFEIDLTPAKAASLNNMYVKTVRTDELLKGEGSVQEWDEVDFRESNASIRESHVEWRPDSDTPVYGFCFWWEAELVEGVRLSTSPFEPPTHWEQVFVPLLEPLQVKRGDLLELKIRSDSRYKVGINVTWDVRLLSGGSKLSKEMSMGIRKGDLDLL